MIRSMTGFGRAECPLEDASLQVEMRAVNHRHLDLQLRLPRQLSALEPAVRGRVQPRFGRGKLELVVSFPAGGGPSQALEIDAEVAGRYVGAARELAGAHAEVEPRIAASALLALPGVARLAERAPALEEIEPELLAAVDRACDELRAMREAEGAVLERELRQRLARIQELLAEVESRAGQVGDAVRERLRKRSAQLERETGLLDEARLHQEIVIAADRLDVTEEIVRLRSHIEQFESNLSGDAEAAPVGRRLEFLLQEMLRETNTIGSKGGDAPIAHRVVDLKTELERIREQVLNVE